MKKPLLLLLYLCLLALPISALTPTPVPPTPMADGRFATAGDLYLSWEGNWPEGICNVLPADRVESTMTFAVRADEEGERAKQAVLDKVAEDSTVLFVTHTATYEELKNIYYAIVTEFGQGYGISEMGITEYYVSVGVPSRLRERAAVRMMAATVNDRYGSAVRLTFDSAHSATDERDLPSIDSLLPESERIVPEAEPLKYGAVVIGVLVGSFVIGFLMATHKEKKKQRR